MSSPNSVSLSLENEVSMPDAPRQSVADESVQLNGHDTHGAHDDEDPDLKSDVKLEDLFNDDDDADDDEFTSSGSVPDKIDSSPAAAPL